MTFKAGDKVRVGVGPQAERDLQSVFAPRNLAGMHGTVDKVDGFYPTCPAALVVIDGLGRYWVPLSSLELETQGPNYHWQRVDTFDTSILPTVAKPKAKKKASHFRPVASAPTMAMKLIEHTVTMERRWVAQKDLDSKDIAEAWYDADPRYCPDTDDVVAT